MDKKKILKELEEQYNKLEAEYLPVREDILDFEGTQEYEKYHALKEDAERKEKFPTQYEMYQRESDLAEKLESLDKQVQAAARGFSKNLDESIAALETRIDAMKEQRDALEQETTRLKGGQKSLKASEAYLSGDRAAVEQAEELETELRKNRASKGQLTRNINAFAKEIASIKEEKDELIVEYAVDDLEAEIEEINVNLNSQRRLSRNEDEQVITGMEELTAETVEEPVTIDEEEIPTQMEELIVEKTNVSEEKLAEKQKEAKEIVEKISQGEKQIEEHSKEYQQARNGIRDIDRQINFIKSTDAFKSGDENALRKVVDLEAELTSRVKAKNVIVAKMAATSKGINALQQEKDKHVKQYGERVLEYATDVSLQKPAEKVTNNNEAPKAEIPKYNPKKYTKLTGYKTGRGDAYTSYVTPPTVETKRVAEAEADLEKELQKRVAELYSRAKKGKTTEPDFYKLSAVMEKPEHYDRFGITTGVVFNKGKRMLKAMAVMAADTKQTAKLSRELLGITAQKASKENGYMSTSAIKDWKGLKTLMSNPEQKIAAEELCKSILALDRSKLDKEQLEVWNRAQTHLKKFNMLRNSLSTYDSVSKSRMKQKLSWIAEFDDDDAKPLPAASNTPDTVGQKDIEQLKDMVNNNPDYSEVEAKETSKDDLVK